MLLLASLINDGGYKKVEGLHVSHYIKPFATHRCDGVAMYMGLSWEGAKYPVQYWYMVSRFDQSVEHQ